MQVLIVEDDVRLAEALATILQNNKYKVDVVHDGAEGLAYAESEIYDVVVLDVMLPKMNGFDVVSELRRKKVGVPVLMLTARDSLGDKVGGLDTTYQYAGDFDLWGRFFQHAKLFVVDVPMGCFRRHDAQKTSTAYQRYQAEALQAFAKLGGHPPNRTVQQIRNRARALVTPDLKNFLVSKGLYSQPPRIVYDWGSATWLITE